MRSQLCAQAILVRPQGDSYKKRHVIDKGELMRNVARLRRRVFLEGRAACTVPASSARKTACLWMAMTHFVFLASDRSPYSTLSLDCRSCFLSAIGRASFVPTPAASSIRTSRCVIANTQAGDRQHGTLWPAVMTSVPPDVFKSLGIYLTLAISTTQRVSHAILSRHPLSSVRALRP